MASISATAAAESLRRLTRAAPFRPQVGKDVRDVPRAHAAPFSLLQRRRERVMRVGHSLVPTDEVPDVVARAGMAAALNTILHPVAHRIGH